MSGNAPGWLGHNPLGRIMIAALLALLIVQGASGIILGGTDIYYPPFGNKMKTWIAEDTTKLDVIKPYSKENVNEEKYKEMREFRKPYITVHKKSYFLFIALILFHIVGAVLTDIREGNGIISAMFSGRKFFKEKPVDSEE